MQTRSAYVKAPWNFEIRDVELPETQKAWALLKVEACGICGTDLNTAAADAADWQSFGHE